MQLTVILHAELLPVYCPLSSNFSTSFQMFHLQQKKQFTLDHRQSALLQMEETAKQLKYLLLIIISAII